MEQRLQASMMMLTLPCRSKGELANRLRELCNDIWANVSFSGCLPRIPPSASVSGSSSVGRVASSVGAPCPIRLGRPAPCRRDDPRLQGAGSPGPGVGQTGPATGSTISRRAGVSTPQRAGDMRRAQGNASLGPSGSCGAATGRPPGVQITPKSLWVSPGPADRTANRIRSPLSDPSASKKSSPVVVS